jgi:hypothetical protein
MRKIDRLVFESLPRIVIFYGSNILSRLLDSIYNTELSGYIAKY